MFIINLEWRIATHFCCFLPSNSREQRSGVGILGIAAHRMLVSHPLCRLLVSFAGTKHCCLTAVNRDGALCCPDFPRDRGLKQVLFFPYRAIDRCTISKFAFRGPRKFLILGRGGMAANSMCKAHFFCKRIPTKSGIRESNPPPRLGKPMHYRCANAAKPTAKAQYFLHSCKYLQVFLHN